VLLIPKINNSNIDKSIETIHKTIMRSLSNNKKTEIDVNLSNALTLYEEYNKTIKNLWSSSSVKDYIA
jgi:hypothetical protein